MKKICFVTAARSEYGLLKSLMEKLDRSPLFQLQLLVTGGHLLPGQGMTVEQIRRDGFAITEIVDCGLETHSPAAIAASMGRMGEGMARALERLQPDYLAVLGDRYELLPICSTAFVMGIPIVHIGGGDVTEGAIDDGVRNAVTMLASWHFPGTRSAAERIVRMTGKEQNVWTVGEPGLDAFREESLLSRDELAENLQLDANARWALMTYHAETRQSESCNLDAVNNCLAALLGFEGLHVLLTYANADYGGDAINARLEAAARENPGRFTVIPSLGHRRYLSFMKQAAFVIGNSSSGIVEAPYLRIPVINIGQRQKGRYQCANIIQCGTAAGEIGRSIRQALASDRSCEDWDYWGDGHFSDRVLRILEEHL